MEMMQTMKVHENTYQVVRLLGKGKGGYCWLVLDDQGNNPLVLKQIHHEPCDYYQFGNKLEAEIRDYITLSKLNLPMPRLLEVDDEREILLKEFVDGPTVMEMAESSQITPDHIAQLKAMTDILYPAGLNIDYYPTNFIADKSGRLFYVDYECNAYDPKWDYEHWGCQFWVNQNEAEQADNPGNDSENR